MKVKSITFYDYALAKKGNEHKSYSEIFDIAWKNSDEGLRVRESRKRTTSLLFTVFVLMLPSILAFIPSTKVFAGTLDMDTLVNEQSYLVTKLQFARKYYKECLIALGEKNSASLFADILKRGFNAEELIQVNDLAEGLSLEEFLNAIPAFK